MTKVKFWKYLDYFDVKAMEAGFLPNLTGFRYETKKEAQKEKWRFVGTYPYLIKLTLSVDCLPKVDNEPAKECAKAARMS